MKSMKIFALLMAGATMIILLIVPSCQHDLVYYAPINPIDSIPIDTIPIDTTHCDTCAVGVISFTEDVLPILQSNCAKAGCHDAITHKENLNTSSYQSLMNTSDIAGNGLGSDFWHALTGGGGNPMPPYPNQPLSSLQLSILQQWILQGAQNTTCTHVCSCDTMNVSFTAKIYPVIQTYCLGCHNAGSAQGGVNLSGYANVLAQVNNGKLMKTIRHETGPGIVAMPYNADKLSDCTIAKFQSWVNAGAPNN